MNTKFTSKSAPNDLSVVMVAGGVGTRLWPLSRKTSPKQFLQIFEDNKGNNTSLVQQTYNRLSPLISNENIFIVAPQNYRSYIEKQLPNVPSENFIAEPAKKGTTAASIFAAIWISKLKNNPEQIIHFLVADDHIEKPAQFRNMIKASYSKANKGKLVVFGVKPTYPATGYGYIEIDPKSKSTSVSTKLYNVKSFKEKPDKNTAQKYIDSGNYYWHGSGYMINAKVLLNEVKKHHPEVIRTAKQLEKAFELPMTAEVSKVDEAYQKFEDMPIEVVLHEKSKNAAMAVMENTWNDLGSWSEVYEVFKKRGKSNVTWGDNDKVIQIDSKNSMIYSSNRMIALVGLDNMIVIETPDAILVCPKDKAQKVKELVNKLKKEKKVEYL